MAGLKIDDLVKKYESKYGEDDYLIKSLVQVKGMLLTQYGEKDQKKLFNHFLRFSKEFDSEKKLDLLSVNKEFKSFY